MSRPAAYCGIAAFKPSTLAWSSSGLVPFAPSFDTIGIFAHRVRDAVTAARVLMPPFLRQRAAEAPSPLTIGIVEDPITEAASAAVANSAGGRRGFGCGGRRQSEAAHVPVSFAQIAGWHKAIIEYEVAHAHPHLEHNPDVSAGLREAVARGRVVADPAYLDAHAALGAARERFWLDTAQATRCCFLPLPTSRRWE